MRSAFATTRRFPEILARHVAALDGRLAADRMIDVLEEAGYLSRLPGAREPGLAELEARIHLAGCARW